ncbi:MAG: exo-beta-N-acetylmuramidase NamZ domain-containing protein [Verrucomicrobiota bacterium]
MRKNLLLVLLLLGTFSACRTAPPPKPTPLNVSSVSAPQPQAPTLPAAPSAPLPPTGPVFHEDKLRDMDAAILQAITDKKLPGGVLWLERAGTAYLRGYGWRSLEPSREEMTTDTIFDAASLTKVTATTPCIMLLAERGKVKFDEPVKTYIPEFGGDGRDAVTIRHLMTHTSGLRPGIPSKPAWAGYDAAIQRACAEQLQSTPGTKFVYSDINFILLGEVVRRASGMPLNEFAAREIFQPLKMNDTGFLPAADKRPRIAPTEPDENGVMLRGVVHDPTSRRMGGVAGHAGLFTTARDLARYARMLLNGGALDGVRVLHPRSVELMTTVQSPAAAGSRRGLGWDIDSSYSGPRGKVFPIGSFGHTGWTGTCLWVDPWSRTFYIFMSNRNHPDGKGNVTPLRAVLGTLAAESVVGLDFAQAPSLPPRAGTSRSAAPKIVKNGIDTLKAQNYAPLRGLRVGLITNHTGVDRERNPTIDLLMHAPEVRLKALFSPEHGIRGVLDEKVGDSFDEKTGLPIYSLYGETRIPKPEHLEGLDALVFDIQDIGCRFYTYPSTMANCMEAAAKAGLKYFVLDRVNPINGEDIDGPVLTGKSTFVTYHTVTVRHGMTVGELARMFNTERGFKADLTVIPLEGWTRGMWFDETSLPWINPSPNMRSLTQATLYPGVGLLETTALSVGRGTDTPFEVLGAPYIDEVKLAEELNRAGLPGVTFAPIKYTPVASVYKDKECHGVRVTLTDRERLQSVDIGIVIALTMQRLYPQDWDLAKFDRLLGHQATIEAIRAGKSLAEIRAMWAADVEKFKERRAKFLLY